MGGAHSKLNLLNMLVMFGGGQDLRQRRGEIYKGLGRVAKLTCACGDESLVRRRLGEAVREGGWCAGAAARCEAPAQQQAANGGLTSHEPVVKAF
jgi:hypothetical protein